MSSRIFIIEDNDIVREMLSVFVSDMAGMQVCGAATTAEEALLDIPAAKPDLLLVDLSLPRMNGADLIQLAQERWPDLPSLVLSGHGEAAYVTRARAAGARGYVLKGNPYELPDAIHSVLRGEEYLSVVLR